MHQGRADGLGHHNQGQRVGLLNERHAQAVSLGQHALGNVADVKRAGEDDQAGAAPLMRFADQLPQIGVAAGLVDAGDEHQFTTEHPFGNRLVFGHIRPAHRALCAGLPGTQAHGLQPGQQQHIAHAQAHASASTTLRAERGARTRWISNSST